MDLRKLKTLIELVESSGIAELEIEEGEERVRITRAVAPNPTSTVVLPATLPAGTPAGALVSAPPVVPISPAEAEGHQVKSPMVGTFFGSPSPEASAFVKVGDHVGPDSTVCIIEAMKVFNEIPAEVAGQIVAVLVENGAAIEFGQPLFKVDTRK